MCQDCPDPSTHISNPSLDVYLHNRLLKADIPQDTLNAILPNAPIDFQGWMGGISWRFMLQKPPEAANVTPLAVRKMLDFLLARHAEPRRYPSHVTPTSQNLIENLYWLNAAAWLHLDFPIINNLVKAITLHIAQQELSWNDMAAVVELSPMRAHTHDVARRLNLAILGGFRGFDRKLWQGFLLDRPEVLQAMVLQAKKGGAVE